MVWTIAKKLGKMNALWFVILYAQELNKSLNMDGIVFSLKKQVTQFGPLLVT